MYYKGGRGKWLQEDKCAKGKKSNEKESKAKKAKNNSKEGIWEDREWQFLLQHDVFDWWPRRQSMQSTVNVSDWQEVCHNNMPVLWITPVSNIVCADQWVTVCACVCSPQPKQPWVSPLNLSHFIFSDRIPGSHIVDPRDELEGVREVAMAVQEHVFIKPGFPRTRVRQGWNGFVSRAE